MTTAPHPILDPRSAPVPRITLLLLLAAAFCVGGIMVLPYACVVFHPVHQRIERRFRRRTLAAAVSTGIIVIAFLAPLTLLAMLVGQELPVNPLVVFLSMLGGVTAFGVTGILVGPVTVAVTIALFRFLREEFGAAG